MAGTAIPTRVRDDAVAVQGIPKREHLECWAMRLAVEERRRRVHAGRGGTARSAHACGHLRFRGTAG